MTIRTYKIPTYIKEDAKGQRTITYKGIDLVSDAFVYNDNAFNVIITMDTSEEKHKKILNYGTSRKPIEAELNNYRFLVLGDYIP